MGTVFGLFWRRLWDNMGHVIFLNFIWFTLTIPVFPSLFFAAQTFRQPSEATAVEAGDTGASAGQDSQGETAGAAAIESTDSELKPAPAEAPEGAAGTDAPGETYPEGEVSAVRAVFAVILLAMSWVVSCAATGLVFYGMADIATEYDFSGYKLILKQYLRKGPVLRSVGLVTLFVVTFIASFTNIGFYMMLAAKKSPIYLGLAGIMLWFVIFLTMTCAMALAVMAQRDLRFAYAEAAVVGAEEAARPSGDRPGCGLWPALKTAAVIALAYPLRTFFVLFAAFCIFLVGLISGAGVGFFILAAPALLFNADVSCHLSAGREKEQETDGDQDQPR